MYKQRNFKKALDAINVALDFESENPDFILILAKIYYGSNQTNLALETIKKAYALNPLNKEITLTMSLWLIDIGNTSAALKLAKSVTEKEPNEPLTLLIFALSYLKENRVGEALKYLKLAEGGKLPFIGAVSKKITEEINKSYKFR
jgi:tetratricopeptide (TPR) repeat protein